MKKLFFLLFTAFTLCSQAQQIEVSGMAGYMWVGQTPSIKLGNNANYSGGFLYSTLEGIAVEFNYTYTQTTPSWRKGIYEDTYGKWNTLTTEYYMLNIMRETYLDKVTAYGLFGLGAGHFLQNASGSFRDEDIWKFAISLGLGAKYYITDRIALRFQTRISGPIQWGGISIGCGSGGCGTGVSAGSQILSFDLQGGVSIVLKKDDNATYNGGSGDGF